MKLATEIAMKDGVKLCGLVKTLCLHQSQLRALKRSSTLRRIMCSTNWMVNASKRMQRRTLNSVLMWWLTDWQRKFWWLRMLIPLESAESLIHFLGICWRLQVWRWKFEITRHVSHDDGRRDFDSCPPWLSFARKFRSSKYLLGFDIRQFNIKYVLCIAMPKHASIPQRR